MLSSIQKLILIPALTFSVGFLFSQNEPDEPEFSHDDYPGHLVGAFTGGFGEQTCHSCHFDYDLNWKEGGLSVSGIPGKVQPGKMYEFRISLERKDLGKAGFQFSSRFRDGSQAGVFRGSGNSRLMFTEQGPDSVQYLQHSEDGTKPIEQGGTHWVVKWQAPESITDSVFFNISANAANGDQSEFGDWIYVKEYGVTGE